MLLVEVMNGVSAAVFGGGDVDDDNGNSGG